MSTKARGSQGTLEEHRCFAPKSWRARVGLIQQTIDSGPYFEFSAFENNEVSVS